MRTYTDNMEEVPTVVEDDYSYLNALSRMVSAAIVAFTPDNMLTPDDGEYSFHIDDF